MNIAAFCPFPVLLFLSTGACQDFAFAAQSEESFSIVSTGVTSIGCTTHNGQIEIVGKPDATSIEVTVAKTTRGATQALADAGLGKLQIVRDRNGDALDLGYRIPKQHDGWNGQASFRVTCPMGMVVRAETHNGGINLSGVGERVHAESHNGSIRIDGRCDEVEVETHNGAIHLQLAGSGPATGTATTHNGGITLELSAMRSAKIEASTHNGSLRSGAGFADVSSSRRSLSARLGAEATTQIRLETHNGNIELATRDLAEREPDVKDG